MNLIRSVLLLPALCLMGCKPAPMTNTIVTQAQSPNGKASALLVDRSYKAARVPDEFFVIVIGSDKKPEEAIAERHLGVSAVLVATWANKVRLRWQTDDVLIAVCESCGLEAINISKKEDHVGTITVLYEGFPARIANQ